MIGPKKTTHKEKEEIKHPSSIKIGEKYLIKSTYKPYPFEFEIIGTAIIMENFGRQRTCSDNSCTRETENTEDEEIKINSGGEIIIIRHNDDKFTMIEIPTQNIDHQSKKYCRHWFDTQKYYHLRGEWEWEIYEIDKIDNEDDKFIVKSAPLL
jgi:hypothetical protein